MKTREELQIKEELFDDVVYLSSSLEIEFFTSQDTSYSIFADGEFGSKENGIRNLITKEQFDEIIRVRALIMGGE